MAPEPLAERLEALLGPWEVAGPALRTGLAALTDPSWEAAQREWLRDAVARLDGVLAASDLRVLGGTKLFRFVEAPPGTLDRLGRAGILVRGFKHSRSAAHRTAGG